ncbi:MAG: hypothetical protein B1H05_04800 [Candidatus Cloacimonas sp. 4484_140]|nr:MAG: hypothetical protein B1H05_04800 [Candidatus Cloacimonas sp. 4484_140]
MNKTKHNRRLSVLINYASMIIILVLFYIVRMGILKTVFLAFEVIPLIAVILSFRHAFVKTGIWKMTHASFKKLDEREVQVVFKATSISYSLFAIAILVIIYIFILSGLGQIDALLAVSLLYFAHILPASIIAWNEKN